MDPLSASALTFGIILLLISWGLLLINSFKTDFTWGLVTLFLPPLSYLYGFWSWSKAGAAISLAALGWLLILFFV